MWDCKHGCEITKTPCPHLEALLPSLEQGRNVPVPLLPDRGMQKTRAEKILYTGDLEKFLIINGSGTPDDEVESSVAFIENLLKYNLDQASCEVLADRFVHNKTFQEIGKEKGMSERHAITVYRTALQKCKEKYEELRKRDV